MTQDIFAPGAERDQEIEAGQRRRAGAGGHDLHLLDAFARELERVLDGGGDDDRGAVLVVVEHRNLHALLQPRLDLETLRCLEVLKIDAAEGRLQRRHHIDDAVDILRIDFDVEHVDAGEFLEQDRLALHHRLAGERADIAEPEHRGAVGDDADEICPRGERCGFSRIGRDRLAGDRDARRIGKRQVMLGGERLGGLDGDFSRLRCPVIGQRARAQIVRYVGRHAKSPPPRPPAFYTRTVTRRGRPSYVRPSRRGARYGASDVRVPLVGRPARRVRVARVPSPRGVLHAMGRGIG